MIIYSRLPVEESDKKNLFWLCFQWSEKLTEKSSAIFAVLLLLIKFGIHFDEGTCVRSIWPFNVLSEDLTLSTIVPSSFYED